jgi:hypothetical protein
VANQGKRGLLAIPFLIIFGVLALMLVIGILVL